MDAFECTAITYFAGPRAQSLFRTASWDLNWTKSTHEAGHTIAGRVLRRRRIAKVSIVPALHADGSMSGGRVTFGDVREPEDGPLPSGLHDMPMVLTCACFSVGVEIGIDGQPEDSAHWPLVVPVIRRYRDATDAILAEHRPALEAVAIELFLSPNGELDAAQIDAALAPFDL